ncbi:hypothetical protein JOF44_000989 [Brachybacterium fresconis]|uniref:Uncharacterized protein n=1 Tax=Brachybacterium fresconis TaxID=173363 RepID=A0ABS4YH16_9MICO|nr:hypothetical protein [Brachybacterium fresconis]
MTNEADLGRPVATHAMKKVMMTKAAATPDSKIGYL